MNRNLITELKQKINIVDHIKKHLKLTQSGKNWVGICPFHTDKHPSLFVTAEKQLFKCFACNTGGDIIKFQMLWAHTDWKQTVENLNQEYQLGLNFNFQIQTTSLNEAAKQTIKLLTDAHKWFQINLYSKQSAQLTTFLQQRKINSAMIEKWKLGWAPVEGTQLLEFLQTKQHSINNIIDSKLFNVDRKNQLYNYFKTCLIVPIYNPNQQLVGFVGRQVTKLASARVTKYLSFPNTDLFQKSELLFNFTLIPKQGPVANQVFLVEGLLDAMRLSLAKFEAVALMGTSLSTKQASLLRQRYQTVIVWFDGDTAGWEGTLNTCKTLLDQKLTVKVIASPSQSDPDAWILQQPTAKITLPSRQEPLSWLIKQQQLAWSQTTKRRLAPFLTTFWQTASYEAQKTARALVTEIFGVEFISALSNSPIQPVVQPTTNQRQINRFYEEEAFWVLLGQESALFKMFQNENYEFTQPLLQKSLVWLKEWYNNTALQNKQFIVFLQDQTVGEERQFFKRIWNEHCNNLVDAGFVNQLFNFFRKKQLQNKQQVLVTKLNQTTDLNSVTSQELIKQLLVLLNQKENTKVYVAKDWKRNSPSTKASA